MANKAALSKAYDAGQAAQRYGYGIGDCPFDEGDEKEAWLAGYEDDLLEKWMLPGRAHSVEISS